MGCGLFVFFSEMVEAQEETPLDRLRTQYQGAVDLLMQPVHNLNGHYAGALQRLLEAESGAGRLENSILVKKALDEFGDGRSFDPESMEAEPSELLALRRLQQTYLTQRKKALSGLAGKQAELKKKYIASLAALEKEQTREQNFELALAVKKEREKMLGDASAAGAGEVLFSGRILFIAKGDIELRHNGEIVAFKDESKDEQYILGISSSVELREDDLIQVLTRGTAVFRSFILLIKGEDGNHFAALNSQDFRVSTRSWMSKSADVSRIDELSQTPRPGKFRSKHERHVATPRSS